MRSYQSFSPLLPLFKVAGEVFCWPLGFGNFGCLVQRAKHKLSSELRVVLMHKNINRKLHETPRGLWIGFQARAKLTLLIVGHIE
jgi:hypothetical protein